MMNPVMEFKSVVLDYSYKNSTLDPVLVELLTSPPGAGPTVARTWNLAKVSRMQITQDLSQAGLIPEGSLWRLRFIVPATATSFILYGGYIEAREIGVFLTGGQTWETPDLGVGQ